MSKKLKRSAVALVLAATMVFSSQGVLTAFAVGENETSTAVDVSALEPILDKVETDVANESGNVNDDLLENVCEICGGVDGQHKEGCSANQQPENTCPVCGGVDGQHEEGCSANQQPENTCPVCGGVDGQHTEDCTANQQPDEGDSGETTCPVCGGVDGQHTEDCTANQQPDEGDSGETTCPECGGVDGQHEENCSLAQESDNTPSEEDVAAAKNVSDLIGALPEASTLDPETTDVEALTAQVKAAREAYDKLTDAQKALVEKAVLDKLVALEGALEGLEQVVIPPTGIPETAVAKIGENDYYNTLDEAIADAEDGEIIEVLADCTTAGLNLDKNLTITAAEGLSEKPTVTFNDKGIALWGISLTFKNCNVVMKGIGSTPYSEWSWQTICASKDASLTLDNVEMTMDGQGTPSGGSATHAIYFCSNNKLDILNGSKLTIKNYSQDALEWDGGDGGYNVNITDSTFISDHNRSGFTGTFYATITNSDVDVINSTGNGSNGSHFIIENSDVNFSNNGSHGLSAGALTIDNSTVTANNNKGMGITVNNEFEVTNNSVVTVTGNASNSSYGYAAVRLYNDFNFLVDNTSELYIKDNNNTGLYVRQGNLNVQDGAVLEITGNDVTHNALGGYGGGIYVGYGDNYDPTVVLPADAKIYNNHALVGGDDIYVSEGVDGPSLTFGKVGEGWTLDGDPDCTDAITGWFDDSEGSRWEAHDAPYHINEFVQFERNGLATVFGLTSLKAAHGIDPIDPGEPGGGDWDENHSKSKTATPLDANYESDVTLSLPSAEEQLESDVVFVLDKSTSTDIEKEALAMLNKLQEQVADTNAKVKVGIVVFNKEAHRVLELTELTEENMDKIQEAFAYKISGGTNTHAGLLAGKAMLDNDPLVDASRKYLVFVSDAITYMYNPDSQFNSEPTAISLQNGDKTNNFAGPDNWATKYGNTDMPQAGWEQWLGEIGSLIVKDNGAYDIPYAEHKNNATYIPYDERSDHAMSIDKALYLTNQVYQEIQQAGYHCYAMKAYSDAADDYPWASCFMDYLANGQEVSFEDIQNDIFYLLDEGSSVVDVIGYGKDDSDNEYNFDFVDNLDNLKITVGGNELDKEDIIDPQFNDPYVTSAYGFSDPASGRDGYDFVLKYYQKGQDGNSDECFVWEINVPVSNFAPVQLTYTVKLTNPQTAEGTYGEYDANGENGSTSLYTNKEATLYPVDSNGDSGVPENFPKPTVSYTVGGNDNPGTDPTPDPDPDPDRPSRPNRDDDDDWEPLPDAPVKDKPTTEVDVPEETETPTTEQPDKYNPETGDTTTVFAAMALAAVSLGGVVLLGRKKK